MILSVCSNSSVLQILYIIKIIIRIICIIVPIILLVSLSISFAKSVTSGEVSETLKNSIPKIVAAILVLLVPTFVKVITNIVGSNGYMGCLNNATITGIKQAKYDEVYVYVEKANKSLNKSDLQMAKSKTNRISDKNQKEELLNEIKEIEVKVNKVEEILNYTESTITQKKYDEAEEFVKTLPDGKVKTKLLEKLEVLKKALTPVINVAATGKALNGRNIVDVLQKNGSSTEEFNNRIKTAVENAGVGTREAAVAAASTLIETLAGYGYKINYEWWGKYANFGINTRWGSILSESQYQRDCNDYAKNTGTDGANCWNNMKWYGLDCSGFAQWIVIQAMQNKKASYSGGKRHNFNTNTNYAQCQIGDPIYRTGHVAIIVKLDEDKKSYIIAESNNGVTYNTVKYTDSTWWCNHITIYSN